MRILFDMNFEKCKLNLLDPDDSDDSEDRDENEDPVEDNGLILNAQQQILNAQQQRDIRRQELTTENAE